MNDPHVKAIHYFIEHDDSVDYRDAEPLVHEDDLFRIRTDRDEVILEPKSHYATEEEARSAVEGLVRRWEFEAALRAGSRSFRLSYARVEIIDRKPSTTAAGRRKGRPRELPLPGVSTSGPSNQDANWISLPTFGAGY